MIMTSKKEVVRTLSGQQVVDAIFEIGGGEVPIELMAARHILTEQYRMLYGDTELDILFDCLDM